VRGLCLFHLLLHGDSDLLLIRPENVWPRRRQPHDVAADLVVLGGEKGGNNEREHSEHIQEEDLHDGGALYKASGSLLLTGQ
jgi:hypothetical protein